MKDVIRMFFYGTFRRRFWNHEQFGLNDLKLVATGETTRPFTMNVICGGIPMVSECQDQPGTPSSIKGEIYDVPLHTASRITSMMNISGFRPKAEVVDTNLGPVNAVLFLFNEAEIQNPVPVVDGDYEHFVLTNEH